MMEKSSSVVLSEEEKAIIKGSGALTKSAGETKGPQVPERFAGWYSHEELKDIADEQD